jgi:hypothetical protein
MLGFAGTWCGIRTGEARGVSLSACAKLLREQRAEEGACGLPVGLLRSLTGTFLKVYVPHRPILAKFRLGFWQIVCPGHRGTVGYGKIRGVALRTHCGVTHWHWSLNLLNPFCDSSVASHMTTLEISTTSP